jgi:guanylate kinase
MSKHGQQLLVTITGMSGAGKTTMQKKLQELGYRGLVSFTTRPMRAGEVHGADYWFLSKDAFELLPPDEILEHIEFNGNQYGLLSHDLKKSDQPAVVVVEPHGVKQINAWCRDNGVRHVSVFLDSDLDVLLHRFLERFREDSNANIALYASRLKSLITLEMGWRDAVKYDLILPAFTEETTESVMGTILNFLKEQQ